MYRLSTTGPSGAARRADLPETFVKSAHFTERQRQRQIPDRAVALTLRFGRRFYEGEEIVFFLCRRDIPSFVDAEEARRASGVHVVAARDGTLVSVYRNEKGIRRLKRRRA